jgi:hypothetical protein
MTVVKVQNVRPGQSWSKLVKTGQPRPHLSCPAYCTLASQSARSHTRTTEQVWPPMWPRPEWGRGRGRLVSGAGSREWHFSNPAATSTWHSLPTSPLPAPPTHTCCGQAVLPGGRRHGAQALLVGGPGVDATGLQGAGEGRGQQGTGCLQAGEALTVQGQAGVGGGQATLSRPPHPSHGHACARHAAPLHPGTAMRMACAHAAAAVARPPAGSTHHHPTSSCPATAATAAPPRPPRRCHRPSTTATPAPACAAAAGAQLNRRPRRRRRHPRPGRAHSPQRHPPRCRRPAPPTAPPPGNPAAHAAR